MLRAGPIILIFIAILGGTLLWTNRSFISGFLPLVKKAPPLPTGEILPFSLPDGFAARLFADGLHGARDMTHDPRGTLLVSLTKEGAVIALPDENADGEADERIEVIADLDNPHGIAFICDTPNPDSCLLYIAEEDALRSYTYDAPTRTAALKKTLTDLPAGGGHFTRSLLQHPNGRQLLIAVGSSCNVCEEKDPRRASILSLDAESKEVSTFATGLRNTVFMAVHPVSGEIWGTDMGRDFLGDDLPPDEINILKQGEWYGWPWFYGKNTEDLTFDTRSRPSFAQEPSASHIDIPAHSAPLGLAFVPEEGWPEEYWHDLLVAYHGSWNRSAPTGYKIVRFDLDPSGRPSGTADDFMTGFMTEAEIIGRPVDLLIEPGGIMYVSDDRAGAIYLITRQ